MNARVSRRVTHCLLSFDTDLSLGGELRGRYEFLDEEVSK